MHTPHIIANMFKTNSVKITLPEVTYQKLLKFAEHIDAISETGNAKPADAAKRAFRLVLNFYSNEKFQKCLEEEGLDTLGYMQRCINRGIEV